MNKTANDEQERFRKRAMGSCLDSACATYCEMTGREISDFEIDAIGELVNRVGCIEPWGVAALLVSLSSFLVANDDVARATAKGEVIRSVAQVGERLAARRAHQPAEEVVD